MMLVTLSLSFVLYNFASFSVSHKVCWKPTVIDKINCPPTKCIGIWTNDISHPWKRVGTRCCSEGVNPRPITPGGQIVPSSVEVHIPSEFGRFRVDPNWISLMGDFPPGATGLISSPDCIGWYELGKFRPQEWSFDESYRLISEAGDVISSACRRISDPTGHYANPYYVPSLNPIERAMVESQAPEDFQGFIEPTTPSILINPGSSIGNPNVNAFDPHGPLNSGGAPTAQGLWLSPDTAPAEVASTTDLDFNRAPRGCTGGYNCEAPSSSWSELNLNVLKTRTPVMFHA